MKYSVVPSNLFVKRNSKEKVKLAAQDQWPFILGRQNMLSIYFDPFNVQQIKYISSLKVNNYLLNLFTTQKY